MRPAGKGPLDSLYFNYPIFPARRVAELDGATVRHPVVIVGAGPIGMTAALVLARYGIRSVLIDRKETFNDGSRALCIARPSMHILERIGAVSAVPRRRRSAGATAAATTAASRSSGSRCRIRKAKNTCRCTICSSNISSNICTTRSRPANSSTCAGRASFPTSIRLRTAYRFVSPRRSATTASRPATCWPPTARDRRSARSSGCA